MKITNILPAEYRAMAKVAALLAIVAAACATAGVSAWHASKWRAEAAAAVSLRDAEGRLSVCSQNVTSLTAKLEVQNAQIEALGDLSKAIDVLREGMAARNAQEDRSAKARLDAMRKAGKDCDSAMRAYWGAQ